MKMVHLLKDIFIGKGQKPTEECVSGKKLRQNHKNVSKARSAVLEVSMVTGHLPCYLLVE